MDLVDVWVIRFKLPVGSTAKALATSFDISEETARVYATSAPLAVKHGASREDGRRFVRLLETIGAEVELVEPGALPVALAGAPCLASLPPVPPREQPSPPRSSSLPPPRTAPAEPLPAGLEEEWGLVDVWVLQFHGGRHDTIAGLQQVFGVAADKAAFFAFAAPLLVKHSVAPGVGRGFMNALRTIGAEVELVAEGGVPASVAAGWPAMPTASSAPIPSLPPPPPELRSPPTSRPVEAPAPPGPALPTSADVWVVGFEVPLAAAVAGLQQVLSLAEVQARMMVASVPAVVRLSLPWVQAAEYAEELRSVGAVVRIVPSRHRPARG